MDRKKSEEHLIQSFTESKSEEHIVQKTKTYKKVTIIRSKKPVSPVAQRYLVTLDTLGREFDLGKRDFSH